MKKKNNKIEIKKYEKTFKQECVRFFSKNAKKASAELPCGGKDSNQFTFQ